MTPAEKQRWQGERAKGRGHFVLRVGLLKAGIPFGFLMTLFKVFLAAYRGDHIYYSRNLCLLGHNDDWFWCLYGI